MDFVDRLKDSINSIPKLPIKVKKGYLSEKESLVLYPLPGGRVLQMYYDGSKNQQLNFEIAMKSKEGNKIEQTLWMIADYLEDIEEIESEDHSFEFDSLSIANKPYVSEADEKGWFVFLLDVQANMTTL